MNLTRDLEERIRNVRPVRGPDLDLRPRPGLALIAPAAQLPFANPNATRSMLFEIQARLGDRVPMTHRPQTRPRSAESQPRMTCAFPPQPNPRWIAFDQPPRLDPTLLTHLLSDARHIVHIDTEEARQLRERHRVLFGDEAQHNHLLRTGLAQDDPAGRRQQRRPRRRLGFDLRLHRTKR